MEKDKLDETDLMDGSDGAGRGVSKLDRCNRADEKN